MTRTSCITLCTLETHASELGVLAEVVSERGGRGHLGEWCRANTSSRRRAIPSPRSTITTSDYLSRLVTHISHCSSRRPHAITRQQWSLQQWSFQQWSSRIGLKRKTFSLVALVCRRNSFSRTKLLVPLAGHPSRRTIICALQITSSSGVACASVPSNKPGDGSIEAARKDNVATPIHSHSRATEAIAKFAI